MMKIVSKLVLALCLVSFPYAAGAFDRPGFVQGSPPTYITAIAEAQIRLDGRIHLLEKLAVSYNEPRG